jgi:hypothetical protein
VAQGVGPEFKPQWGDEGGGEKAPPDAHEALTKPKYLCALVFPSISP